MTTRHLYLARHGAADAFGELAQAGPARVTDVVLHRLPPRPSPARPRDDPGPPTA